MFAEYTSRSYLILIISCKFCICFRNCSAWCFIPRWWGWLSFLSRCRENASSHFQCKVDADNLVVIVVMIQRMIFHVFNPQLFSVKELKRRVSFVKSWLPMCRGRNVMMMIDSKNWWWSDYFVGTQTTIKKIKCVENIVFLDLIPGQHRTGPKPFWWKFKINSDAWSWYIME